MKPTDSLVLTHTGSGATRSVWLDGFGGVPLRPIVYWPGAGQYELSLKDGSLLGGAANAAELRLWKVDENTLRRLRRKRQAIEFSKQRPVM